VQIKIRRFNYHDPEKIVRNPDKKYLEAPNTIVCIKTIKYGKKNCKVAVFYTQLGVNAIIKTIHATNSKQITSKATTGKWVEVI
jgi:16S rRNA U1498 N3-methylase RsmE